MVESTERDPPIEPLTGSIYDRGTPCLFGAGGDCRAARCPDLDGSKTPTTKEDYNVNTPRS